MTAARRRPSSRPARLLARALPLLLVVSLAAACRPADDPSRPVTVAVESSPTHPDPRMGTDQASDRIGDLAFRGLVRRRSTGGAEPDLAASWDWEPGGILALHLRPGLRFVDGRPLAAADVVFTYASLLDPATASPKRGSFTDLLDLADPVAARGDDTVLFRCAGGAPCPALLPNLSLGIVPRGTSPDDTRARPVGAGPLTLERLIDDDEALFTAPGGGRVALKVIPDATSRALALLDGRVDLAMNALPPDVVERFRRDRRFVVRETAGTNVAYLGFACNDPILSDRRVREAIALAIDRAALATHLFRGLVDPTESLLPVGHVDRAADLPPIRFDPARARALLDEAGFPLRGDGPRLRLTYTTSTDETAVLQATAIQSMLGDVGIDVAVRTLDFSTFYADVKAGRVQLWSLTWTAVVDPGLYRMAFHSQLVPPAGWNRGRYANRALDRLLDAAGSTVDPPAAGELWRAAQRIVRDELPYVPLWHRRNVVVARRELSGVEPDPLGDFRFLASVRREADRR